MEFSQQTIQQMLDAYLVSDAGKTESTPFFIYKFSESHNIYAQGCRVGDDYDIEITGEDFLTNPEHLEESGIKYLELLGWEDGPAGNFVCSVNKTELENGDVAKLIWNSLEAYNTTLDDKDCLGYEIQSF
tara:strand:+ start:589 stop:978 length:390 start_codon:yes stop_codon:yes gene_type:complete